MRQVLLVLLELLVLELRGMTVVFGLLTLHGVLGVGAYLGSNTIFPRAPVFQTTTYKILDGLSLISHGTKSGSQDGSFFDSSRKIAFGLGVSHEASSWEFRDKRITGLETGFGWVLLKTHTHEFNINEFLDGTPRNNQEDFKRALPCIIIDRNYDKR